jgi:hypothetical protein
MKIKKLKEHYESSSEDSSVLDFLYNLNDPIINGDVNSLIKSHDDIEKKEIIEDILLYIGDILDDENYHRIENGLNNMIIKK